MTKINIESAEWNPDNQIICKIADCGEIGDSIAATRRKVTIENCTEDQAINQNVIDFFAEKGMQVVNNFKIN